MQRTIAAADGSDESNIGSSPLKQVGSASDALERDEEHSYYRPSLGGGNGGDKKGRSKSLSGALGGLFGLRRDITTSAASGGGKKKKTNVEGGSGDVSGN